MVRFEVTPPRFISGESMLAAGGVAGGVIFGEYLASLTIGASGMTGTAALATSLGTKAVLGMGAFMLSRGQTGTPRTLLWMGSIGAGASIIADLFEKLWGAGFAEEAGLAHGTALRGGVAPAKPVRVRPTVAARAPTPKAETPSGEALGGF